MDAYTWCCMSCAPFVAGALLRGMGGTAAVHRGGHGPSGSDRTREQGVPLSAPPALGTRRPRDKGMCTRHSTALQVTPRSCRFTGVSSSDHNSAASRQPGIPSSVHSMDFLRPTATRCTCLTIRNSRGKWDEKRQRKPDFRSGGGGGGQSKRPPQQPAQPQYANYWAPLAHKRTPCHIQHSPNTTTTGLRERGNDTSRSTGRSGRQKAATRRNMRREERVTVQGPVKTQQPDGMSHRGGHGSPPKLGGGGVVLEKGSHDRDHYFHRRQGRQKEYLVNDGLRKKGDPCMSTTCCLE